MITGTAANAELRLTCRAMPAGPSQRQTAPDGPGPDEGSAEDAAVDEEAAVAEVDSVDEEAVDETTDADPAEQSREARWRWALLAICVVALGVRLVYLFGWQDFDEVGGDAWYYHEAANLLAEGEGFVHPYLLEEEGVRAPGADHPPGYSTVLAPFSLVGLDSIRAHQVVTCLIGTGTVALMGLVGHRLGGRRRRGRQVGLIAAGFAAVYPNIWMNDPSLMSESLAMFAGVGFTLAAYWAWDRPNLPRLATLGALLGAATLVRAEAAMLFVFVVVPLCAWAPRLAGWRPRLAHVAVAGAASGLVIAPWVVPNLVRFEHPATLSTQMGPTLEVGNCDLVYYGSYRSSMAELEGLEGAIGGWTHSCASELVREGDLADAGIQRITPAPTADESAGSEAFSPASGSDRVLWVRAIDGFTCRLGQSCLLLGIPPGDVDPYDRSELDDLTTDAAVDYMADHKGRLPFVAWARFGRAFGLYAPIQQVKYIDTFTDQRPYDAARVGLGLYYVTAAAAVVGVVALRRRGVPSFPLTASILSVAITVVVFYGTTRFRAPAEPAFVLLGAVGAQWVLSSLFRRRRQTTPEARADPQ